ncbi:transglutaminase domain-containing protein [Saccharibacillus sp. CPCC 101409]|uniref:transglutaminase domain-containing protein n=1 Tax=Saccharibacillus sp. CPCC 101409 TaxID=3058041 RepID=UPI002672449E|nr:transglutaminase domain-containing protein [Saccharibacillus sp. CPCC 101409]MDO3412773.1 transglutaminase domain-containing protein [Saccharibacillus sp. CPCC 101409]
MKGRASRQILKLGMAFALVAGGALGGLHPLGETATAAAVSAQAQSQTQLQNQIYQALTARKGVLNLTYAGGIQELKKAIEPALNAAIEQDPYIHYTMKGYAYSLRGTSASSSAELKLTYRETAQQSAYVHQKVGETLKQITTPDMNDHLKVKAIHDWVVRSLKYDQTLSKFTAYDGLKTGSAVCQGYALLTYDLLKQAGFETNIVEGYVEGTAHAWNMVKLGGKWYQLDTTWDDPVPDRGDRVSTAYYLVTDSQLKRDHVWTSANYPQAVTLYADTLNALAAKGVTVAKELRTLLGYNNASSDSAAVVSTASMLRQVVKQADSRGESQTSFQYKGTREELKTDLRSLTGQGISGIRYTSKALEGTNNWRVTLYWK